jgi:hypothetical protein
VQTATPEIPLSGAEDPVGSETFATVVGYGGQNRLVVFPPETLRAVAKIL